MNEKRAPPDYDLKVKAISPAEFHEHIKNSMKMQQIIGITSARDRIIDLLRRKGFSEQEASDISHGKGVRIALVNSGVDVTHPEIAERFAKGNEGENFVNWTYDANGDKIPCEKDPHDLKTAYPHGICVAGILSAKSFGVLRKPELYVAKVCDDFGHLEEESLEEALSEIRGKNFDIVNMSIGFLRYKGNVTKRLYDLCEYLGRKVVLVASADNQYNGPSFPSSFPNVISVVATCCADKTDAYHTACDFSNAWPTVDVGAPGERILCPNIITSKYALMSGTSAAAPIVTGILGMAVAYLKARSRLSKAPPELASPLKLEQMLKDTSHRSERRPLMDKNDKDEIELAFGRYFGFHLLDKKLTAGDFTNFALGAGRVDAEKFICKVMEEYPI